MAASGLFVPYICVGQMAWRRAVEANQVPPAGGGGGGAWYDTELQAATDTDAGSTIDELNWSPVVVTTGGSCTKGRIYINGTAPGTFNIKMGVNKDSDGTILASGSGTYDGTQHAYTEITWGTPVTLASSTTYRAAWILDNNNASFRYKAGADNWRDNLGFGYANYPGTLPAPTFDLARGFAVGLWVQ